MIKLSLPGDALLADGVLNTSCCQSTVDSQCAFSDDISCLSGHESIEMNSEIGAMDFDLKKEPDSADVQTTNCSIKSMKFE